MLVGFNVSFQLRVYLNYICAASCSRGSLPVLNHILCQEQTSSPLTLYSRLLQHVNVPLCRLSCCPWKQSVDSECSGHIIRPGPQGRISFVLWLYFVLCFFIFFFLEVWGDISANIKFVFMTTLPFC